MSETKRQMSLYSFYDHTGIERHLARMAEQGWLLCGIGQFFWHYRRIEPRRITFCVSYFPKADIFDPGPSEGQEEFYDLCAHAGWTLAGSSAQLQVFYHEGENPTPIDTDPALEVEAIHRSAKKGVLPSNFLLLGVGVMDLAHFLWRLRADPILTLSNAGALLAALSGGVLLALCSVELASYFLWWLRARRAAERGEFLPTHSHRWFQGIALALLAAGLAWIFPSMFRSGLGGVMALGMAGAVGLLAATLGIREGLKRARFSAGENRAITLIACVALSILFSVALPWFVIRGLNRRPDPGPDELPLSVAELAEVDASRYSRWQTRTSSPLLACLQSSEHVWSHEDMARDMPGLEYHVTVVKVPALYELCRETKLHERDGWGDDLEDFWYGYAYAPTDPAPWGAEEAYQWLPGDGADKEADNNQYLLCYPDRVVEISLEWDQPPTPDQMAAVGEKLGRGPL